MESCYIIHKNEQGLVQKVNLTVKFQILFSSYENIINEEMLFSALPRMSSDFVIEQREKNGTNRLEYIVRKEQRPK